MIKVGDTVQFQLSALTDWAADKNFVTGTVCDIQPDEGWGLCYHISWTSRYGSENIAKRRASAIVRLLTDTDIDDMVSL